jgi:SET domain-containing protein
MNKDIVIKKSKIIGKGVFAARDFKKGEMVLKLEPKEITKKEAEKVSSREAHYLWHFGKKYFLMQPPGRYVNHSCDANTTVRKNCDVAKRDIKKGEEITSNYARARATKRTAFVCKCGSKNCKGMVR